MYDMTIALKSDGSKHLYEQIYEHIRVLFRYLSKYPSLINSFKIRWSMRDTVEE